MDLSVVVLSWNTAALTVRALFAAEAGARPLSCELLCVDNGSRDGSPGRVRREVPGARVIENGRNLGFAAGNNRALPHLRGRYTCFLNSDAAPEEGAIAHVARWLDRHPEFAIASPRLVGPDGKRQAVARPEPSLRGLLHRYTAWRPTPLGRADARAWTAVDEADAPHETDSVNGACLVVRTGLLLALGGFDEGYPFYWEDVDLCLRARRAGGLTAFVPDGPPVLHEGGEATRRAGGAPRLAFVVGLLRYVQGRLGPREARRFAALFVPSFLLRALVEPPRLLLQAARRASRGELDGARRNVQAARSWMRLLERDAAPLVRLLGTGVDPRGAARSLPRSPQGRS